MLQGADYPYIEKILTLAAAGELPDILPLSQVILPNLVESNVLRPFPDELVAAMSDEYLPGAIQPVTYKDTVWGFPTENMPLALTYDTVRFAQAGVGGFPDTWEDLTKAQLLSPEVVKVADFLHELVHSHDIVRFGGPMATTRRRSALLLARGSGASC